MTPQTLQMIKTGPYLLNSSGSRISIHLYFTVSWFQKFRMNVVQLRLVDLDHQVRSEKNGGFNKVIPVGGNVGSGGRLCTRFLGSQVHADGSGPGSQVHADGSGQGRKGNGLVCTRSQGPHLYTRPRASSVHAEWFCCMYTFVLTAVYFVCSMCARCQVQVFSNLTAVYFVCSMCAGCQVHINAFWTCVKYVPKQSIP